MDNIYTYLIDDFLNSKVDLTKLDKEVRDSSITVSLNYINLDETGCDFYFRDILALKDHTTLSGVVDSHDGISDEIDDSIYVSLVDSKVNLPVDITQEYRDRSGKLRVHQTSRKLGTIISWTGEGDDPSTPSDIGGGEPFSFTYKIGQSIPLVKYIDFNMVENETWLHEGYITWKDCYLDALDLKVVSTVTSTVTSSGTNYDLYGGYLIVPAIPGTGTIDIISDITTSSGGLVFMPKNDLNEASIAYWNAEWDTVTKKFTNITAAPSGDGEYNMFSVEVTIAHFVRKMPLLNSGFIALNSSDTDELGHGMRLKMAAYTNISTDVGDHDWAVACTMCLHRARTV